MAKNLSALRQTFCITLTVCLLSALSLPHLYSQNDISHNGNPVVEMRFVPSCTPTTDASAAQTGANPVKGFYIAKHKVTRQLWNEIMGTLAGGETDDTLPVCNVSRDEVQLFILWLNQKTGMQYRLPTEAEWTCIRRNGIMSGNARTLCSDGGDASEGFRLAMDDPEEIRAAEAAKRAEQERNAAEKAAADSARQAEQDRIARQQPLPDPVDYVAALRQQRIAKRQARLNALPPSVFFTLNAVYTSMPQWSFGFKVGTMRRFGWYLSAMTNFNYRGAFSPFEENGHYVLTGVSKTTYLGGQVGLVIRPIKLLSIHIGAGFGYRTLNFQSDQGWHNFPKRNYYGPTASAGIMFHIKNVVLSAEATGMAYNLNPTNDVRGAWGVRMGVGLSFPIKNYEL